MSCSLPCPLGNSAGGRIPAGVQCLLSEGRYSPESIPHCGPTTAPAPPPSTSCLLRQSPPQPLVPLRAEPSLTPGAPAGQTPDAPSGQSPWCPSGQSPHSPGCLLRVDSSQPRGLERALQTVLLGEEHLSHMPRPAGSRARCQSSLMSPGHSVVPRPPGARLCLALCGL